MKTGLIILQTSQTQVYCDTFDIILHSDIVTFGTIFFNVRYQFTLTSQNSCIIKSDTAIYKLSILYSHFYQLDEFHEKAGSHRSPFLAHSNHHLDSRYQDCFYCWHLSRSSSLLISHKMERKKDREQMVKYLLCRNTEKFT